MLDEDVAVLMLTHVNYRNGYRHDMAALTRAAHDKGILVIWDLASYGRCHARRPQWTQAPISPLAAATNT